MQLSGWCVHPLRTLHRPPLAAHEAAALFHCSAKRRGIYSLVKAGVTPPSFSSQQLPRIVDSIPRKGPVAGFPHFPEVNLRDPIRWVQNEAASDRYSWPVLLLAAVALAVLAEAALIAKDKLTGQNRQSRSERPEVQEASRQADDGQAADAFAQQLANATEPERQLLIAEQEYKKQLLQTDRMDERNRGLLWLAVATVAMLWISGAFEIDATHPFIF